MAWSLAGKCTLNQAAKDASLYSPRIKGSSGRGWSGGKSKEVSRTGWQTGTPYGASYPKTQKEGLNYFQIGKQYLIEGMLFTYVERDGSHLFTNGFYNLFVDDSRIGTFLPDVASCGREHVAVKDKQYLPLCLPKSLRKYVESMRKQ